MVALIVDETGLVVNAILCEDIATAPVPPGCVACPQDGNAGIGWRRNGDLWTAPPEDVTALAGA